MLVMAERHGVAFVDGLCQNRKADGSGVCGQPLSAHPSQQGKYIVIIIVPISNVCINIDNGHRQEFHLRAQVMHT